MTTTNSSCLGSSSLLCRELVPVGYYQRPGRSEIFWWEWCALAGSLAASRWPSMKYETETTDHLSLLHLVFYILVKKKKKSLMCVCTVPGSHSPSWGNPTERRLSSSCQKSTDFQSKGWAQVPDALPLTIWGHLIPSKYLGADRPSFFYTHRNSTQVDVHN